MKTKSKIMIIMLAIIVLLLVIFTITIIGVKRTAKKPIKEPVIKEPSIQNVKYEELENIPLDYDFAKMVEDKCYIVMNGNTIYNVSQMENFVKNVKNSIADEIRIVQYTIEGEPIITDVEYTKEKFIIKHDSRRDHWSAEKDRIITTKEYDADKFELIVSDKGNTVTNKRIDYLINLVSKTQKLDIYICNYVQISKADEKFKIIFTKNNEKEKNIILGKDENSKYDYNIYSYKGEANIIIGSERMSLRDALISNKISISEILEKASNDLNDGVIYGAVYRDGGSKMYIYDDYSIIKYNTLDGDKDFYIGTPAMNINDLK